MTIFSIGNSNNSRILRKKSQKNDDVFYEWPNSDNLDATEYGCANYGVNLTLV